MNNTGANITRLRFRVIDLDTFPAASGFADLRPSTSGAVVVAGINDSVTCTAAGQATPCSVTVEGTDLEGGEVGEVPNQPNGGGFNSSLSAGTVTLGTPLANGASIDLQFLLGIQQTGSFRFLSNIIFKRNETSSFFSLPSFFFLNKNVFFTSVFSKKKTLRI